MHHPPDTFSDIIPPLSPVRVAHLILFSSPVSPQDCRSRSETRTAPSSPTVRRLICEMTSSRASTTRRACRSIWATCITDDSRRSGRTDCWPRRRLPASPASRPAFPHLSPCPCLLIFPESRSQIRRDTSLKETLLRHQREAARQLRIPPQSTVQVPSQRDPPAARPSPRTSRTRHRPWQNTVTTNNWRPAN